MEQLDTFAKIAPYLANPLVLVGFVLFLLFGVHRTLIRSGILQPLSSHQSGAVLEILLRYGFFIALLLIVAGFGYSAWVTSSQGLKKTAIPDYEIVLEADTSLAIENRGGAPENLTIEYFPSVHFGFTPEKCEENEISLPYWGHAVADGTVSTDTENGGKVYFLILHGLDETRKKIREYAIKSGFCMELVYEGFLRVEYDDLHGGRHRIYRKTFWKNYFDELEMGLEKTNRKEFDEALATRMERDFPDAFPDAYFEVGEDLSATEIIRFFRDRSIIQGVDRSRDHLPKSIQNLPL